ncbi:hypothetical protein GCM10025786_28860 [Nocardioides caeni]
MIVGVATVTIVRSTRIMKNPMTRAHSAGHGFVTSEVLSSCGGALWVTSRVNTRAPTSCDQGDTMGA